MSCERKCAPQRLFECKLIRSLEQTWLTQDHVKLCEQGSVWNLLERGRGETNYDWPVWCLDELVWMRALGNRLVLRTRKMTGSVESRWMHRSRVGG